MKIIDITKPLHSEMEVWPGDEPFNYNTTMSIDNGDTVNVGKITMSTHTGTHLDAPFHYDRNGITVDQIPLEQLCGECLVIDAVNKDIIDAAVVSETAARGVRKLLFKTTANSAGQGYGSYPVFTVKAVEELKNKGIHLAGTDAPSVDPLESNELPAHRAFNKAGIFILEGLDLHAVKPGIYHLTAFPLKLKDGDGAPVRAVLKDVQRS